MKTTAQMFTHAILFGLALGTISISATAQTMWKWRDANGTIQYSDRPPPSSVPSKAVLSQPGGMPIPVAAAPAAAPASAASAPASVDKELDAKKKKLQSEKQAADAAKQEEEKKRRATVMEENCRRARNQLAALESGQRIGRFNDKGEREVLDDKARAEETTRARDNIAASCQQP